MNRSEKTLPPCRHRLNNEMVLGNKKTSCSAVPQPQDARLRVQNKNGHESCSGAIDVKINGSGIKITTINDMPPVGICGSGLVDAISELLKAGVITKAANLRIKKNSKNNCPADSKGIRAKTSPSYSPQKASMAIS